MLRRRGRRFAQLGAIQRQERPRCPVPSHALPASACPGGVRWILGCVPHALGSPARQPLLWSLHPSPSQLFPAPLCALQPCRELRLGVWCALPRAKVSVCAPRILRASPPSWGPAPTPCEPLSAREGRCSSWVSGTGLSCPGVTPPASARLLAGPLPLGGLCLFISFSPSSYLDRSANSSHCSIPAGLSLNLRLNS